MDRTLRSGVTQELHMELVDLELVVGAWLQANYLCSASFSSWTSLVVLVMVAISLGSCPEKEAMNFQIMWSQLMSKPLLGA